MVADSKESRLRDLSSRFGRIDCLASPTKKYVLAHANYHSTSEQLSAYLAPAAPLAFVEREIAPLDEPRFRSLCVRLAAIEDLQRLSGELELSNTADHADWLAWAEQVKRYPDRCLYCLANHYAGALSPPGPDSEALAVSLLADAFWLLGRPGVAVRMLETHVGLAGFDYRDTHDLRLRLEGFARRLDPNLATSIVRILANALRFAGRPGRAVRVLEAHAGLTGVDYRNVYGMRLCLANFTRGLAPDMADGFLRILATALRFTGRFGDAAVLLEFQAGLAGARYEDADELRRRLAGSVLHLDPNTIVGVLRTLANVLRLVDRIGDAVRLLEVHAGLTETDYERPDKVREKLKALTLLLTANDAAGFLQALARALCSTDRRGEHAALLLEAHSGLAGTDYADRDELHARLASFVPPLQPSTATGLLRVLADALHASRRVGDAVRLLEAHAGLTEDGYADPSELRQRMAAFGRGRQVGTVASFWRVLAELLDADGRADHAALILDFYADGFPWLEDEDEAKGPIPGTTCHLTELWLKFFHVRDLDRALNVCERLLPYLRRSTRRPDLRHEDRQLFIQRIRPLRRRVVQVAYHAAAMAVDPVGADHLRSQALLWDAELSQRLLVERYLLGQIEEVEYLDADSPEEKWPFDVSEPDWPGHADDQDRGATPLSVATFEAIAGVPEDRFATPVGRPGSLDPPEWVRQAEDFVSRGLAEADLTQAVGPNTIFLRATFAPDGRLLWTAATSVGRQLTILAHDAGAGTPYDRDRIAWAAAHHDMRLMLAYLNVEQRKTVARAFVEDFENLVTSLRTKHGSRWFAADFTRDLQVLMDGWRSSRVEELQRLAHRVGASFRPLLDPSAGRGELSAWSERAARQCQRAVDLVQDAVNYDTSYSHLADLINRATEDYLQEIAIVWKLDDLAKSLSSEIDLVVQVDDALHAVPVAHLRVGGRPLWQQVCSIRASLSLLLDALQYEVEQVIRRRQSEAPPRLLTVSHFHREDGAIRGAVSLHHGQINLAKEHGLAWYAAAIVPSGRMETLFRGLDQGAIRALTVCGHGDEFRAGIYLAGKDGKVLWNGRGHDLSGVDLLLLASCSLGRVKSSGDRDVEGFCVELALHGARSVLSYRWPVACEQAANITNEVLAQYLNLKAQRERGDVGPDQRERRLRAQALNLARRKMLSDDGSGRYLNTIAACDLWGLG